MLLHLFAVSLCLWEFHQEVIRTNAQALSTWCYVIFRFPFIFTLIAEYSCRVLKTGCSLWRMHLVLRICLYIRGSVALSSKGKAYHLLCAKTSESYGAGWRSLLSAADFLSAGLCRGIRASSLQIGELGWSIGSTHVRSKGLIGSAAPFYCNKMLCQPNCCLQFVSSRECELTYLVKLSAGFNKN